MKSKQSKPLAVQLQTPFLEDDIKWRVQQAGVSSAGNPYVMVIPYVSNRAIQKRLDDVFGVMGWGNTYKPTPDGKGYICGITAEYQSKEVTKWDGAEYTHIEPLKGALSDSMKRCAVQFGIGRYLYDLEAYFADCSIVAKRSDGENVHVHYPDKKNRSNKQFISWRVPNLPSWALPFNDHSEFIDAIEQAEEISDLRAAFENAYKASQAANDPELEQLAVTAKDKRKSELLQNMEQTNKAKIAAAQKVLDDEMRIFESLPTAATIDHYYKVIFEKLQTRTKEFDFDASSLFEYLETGYKAVIKNLKSKGKK